MRLGLVLHEWFDSTQQKPSASTVREYELLVGAHWLANEANTCTLM